MKILVIDDDDDTLEYLEELLRMHGHDAVLARSAAEGLQKLEVYAPEMVLLDMFLPDALGLDVLKSIKSREHSLPVAIITAYRDTDKLIAAFRLGAFDCILKPFHVDYIINSVIPKAEKQSGRVRKALQKVL